MTRTDPEFLEALWNARRDSELWRAASIEERVLAALDPNEGTESFGLLPVPLRSARGALQRLRRKGLARCTQAPDGAWIWYRGDENEW